MKIIALVVTYNRLALLKESVEAIRMQSRKPEVILIINNGSTDATKTWLDNQADLVCIHQENLGCSAGFNIGIKKAFQQNAEWVWAMDDDSIPHQDALEKLLITADKISPDHRIGFLSSRVEWTDGNPHIMNIPHVGIFQNGLPFNYFDTQGATLIATCSFVSVLYSRDAIAEVGIPYKEFIIWGDDEEYSKRITKKGFLGLYVPSSIVLHKTAQNYSASIFEDNEKNIWKYEHGIRNKLFTIKRDKGLFSYFFKLLKHYVVIPFKILKKRKTHQWLYIKKVWQGANGSIFFSPKIEKAD